MSKEGDLVFRIFARMRVCTLANTVVTCANIELTTGTCVSCFSGLMCFSYTSVMLFISFCVTHTCDKYVCINVGSLNK